MLTRCKGQSMTFDSNDISWKWASREKGPDFYKKMNCSSAVNHGIKVLKLSLYTELIPVESWYVNLKSVEYCDSLRTDFPMKKENDVMDCDSDSPMRDSVRQKVCSTNQADLDPTFVELGGQFKDIKELLFEREMELISHVFALPTDEVVMDFKTESKEPILLPNGQVMVRKALSFISKNC